MLAEALRAAIQAGTSIDTTAAAMHAASRTPATQPNRKHDPVPPLKPSSRAAVAVSLSAAVLGDLRGKHGHGGNTPLASEAGSEKGEESEEERGEAESEEESQEESQDTGGE